jgi:hypothetical protein
VSRSAAKRLDFFIVGAQKSGTTALAAKLAFHPGLCCSSPKELHLFDNDDIDWTMERAPDLAGHFPGADPDLLWGEATPIYKYWPHAIERLARYNPEAKIMIGLRHPAYRALSHWKKEVMRQAEDLSFAQAISELGRARVNPVHRVFSYVERGFYAPQIARVLALFPRQNVFFYRMEDLYTDEAAVPRAILAFLGVAGMIAETGPKYVVPLETSGIAIDATAELAHLSDLYHSDIRETARLTGLSLDSWLNGTYEENYLKCAPP